MQVNQPQSGTPEAIAPRYDTIVIRGAKGNTVPKEVDGGEVVSWARGHSLAAMDALEHFVDDLAAGDCSYPDAITKRAQSALDLMTCRLDKGWGEEGNVMNYDPNLTCSGKMATQKVRLTFGCWQYRAEIEVSVGGNCTGLAVIDCAVANAYKTLQQRGIYGTDETYAVIVMVDPAKSDSTLECGEDDGGDVLRGDFWLKDMLIGAEITSIASTSVAKLKAAEVSNA